MAVKNILVDCSTCKGTGKQALPLHLKQTLDGIRQGCETAAELKNFVWVKYDDKVTIGSMCQRLSKLYLMNMVTRVQRPRSSGRSVEWAYKLK